VDFMNLHQISPETKNGKKTPKIGLEVPNEGYYSIMDAS